MRGAAKGEEPEDLRTWRAEQAGADLKPHYGDLDRVVQRALKQALFMSQSGQCVYCGRRLLINSTGDEQDVECHVEHFRPRARRPDLEVDYGNLFLSCNGGLPGRDGEAQTCGHRKADWFDADCHVAPVPEEECQQRFAYGGDGQVGGNETAAADKMIEVLNLNAGGLVHDRSELIEDLEAQLEQMGAGEDADLEEATVRVLISDYAVTKPDGTRDSFTHVAVRYLNQYLQPP